MTADRPNSPHAPAAASAFDEAVAARQAGQYGAAAERLDALLAEDANAPRLVQRGLVELSRGAPADAAGYFRRACAARPDGPRPHLLLATACNQAGAPGEALAALDAVPAPGWADWHYQRGRALLFGDDAPAAEPALQEAVRLAPQAAAAWNDLARAQGRQGKLGAAEDAYATALARARAAGWPAPRRAWLAYNLGLNRREQGRFAAARAALDDALAEAPDFVPAANYRLFCQHYDPGESAASLYRAHLAWQAAFAAGLEAAARPPAPRPASGAPLRVGVLAGNFYRQPGLWLYLPVFEHLDPQRIQLIAYDFSPRHDDFTRRFAAACYAWRGIHDLDDAQAAELMRADGLDALVNKNGHAEGRLLICARKPAPVQVQWGGYNTTALAGMDAFLSDWTATPPGAEAFFTERLYRLPADYVAFEPPADLAPPVGPLPAGPDGPITFGCFNHPAKLNSEIATLWAELLRRVPGSYLFLKGKAVDDARALAHLRATLAAAGLPADRLVLEGQAPHGELLAAYNRVDIALDPWPYSGGLTTLEALWMGVPVVTRPGPSFAGRHAATHLTAVGLRDWIAPDGAAYVELAAAAAHDRTRLAELRADLRARVARSPICDGPGFARTVEAVLAQIWADATASGEGPSGHAVR